MSSSDPEDEQHELEEFLRGVPPESGDPLRREEARLAFLGAGDPALARAREVGKVESREQASDRMGRVTSSDENEVFAGWMREAAPIAPADGNYRARARLAFLSLASDGVPRPRASRPFLTLVWMAAAAAIVAVTFFLPEEERWNVRLDGGVSFAEAQFTPGDDARLAALLEGAGTIEAEETAHLSFAGQFELDLLAGSALVLPPLPQLDGVSPIHFELLRGEAHLRTAASYAGNPIRIRTQDAEVALHGTTVGVLVGEMGTCVCVADGSAHVTGVGLAQGREVASEGTLFVFRDEAMGPKLEPFPGREEAGSEHTRALADFRDRP